jgi:dihydrofolate synthase/folylpolyglutamate synthase
VGLRGRHQAANVAVADALLDALEAAGMAVADTAQRRAGFEAARWPGRLELLDVDGREVLLDGAHNPAGGAALAQALDDLRSHLRPGPLTLVTASMADKDVAGVVRALAGSAALAGARIICTQLDLARSLDAGSLAATWEREMPGSRPIVEPGPAAALDRALEGASGPIVVAGSLYLVGRARARLVDDPILRDPEERSSR